MNRDRGYITVASRERRFLEFATDLALSVREFNPEPIALILGDELRPLATMRWLFEGVRRRRAAAGLPPNDSIMLWLNKSLSRDGRAKDSAARFGLWPGANAIGSAGPALKQISRGAT